MLYPVVPSGPRSFRRKNRAVFVVGVDEAETFPRGWEKLQVGSPTLGDAQAAVIIALSLIDSFRAPLSS